MSADRFTPYVRAFALGSASFLSGYIAAFSVGIPAVKLSRSTHAAQQWRVLSERGRSAPLIGLASFSAFSYLAYQAGNTPRGRAIAAAGAATIAIVPFTLTIMWSNYGKLNEWARRVEPKGEDKEGEVLREAKWKKEVDELLDNWQMFNFVRASMPAVGSVVGFWAIFGW